ncbi:MAG: hypothetical protein H7Y17_10905 [Chlorobia bacterium]|nr:hypothetical protein [Fimbriimonadaceae bacterium]
MFSDKHRFSLEAPEIEPTRIAIRWQGDIVGVRRFLGDHWERSYGDLEWRAEIPDRPMPWYFLAYDGKRTHGYGVRTRPSSFCFWNADRSGITLWLDVRNGGKGVVLGEREIELCEVVSREGDPEESAFQAHQAFCRQMCPYPRLTSEPVYGTNDWYSLYGQNSAHQILEISQMVGELAPNVPNRPFSVIDAGWSPGGCDEGPYDQGNERFGDMAMFASQLKDLGVRPGLWIRPLVSSPDTPESWRLSRDSKFLDPTHPEVSEHVLQMVKRVVEWGYELIKHDFTSWDITGKWGFEIGASLTPADWAFQDRSRTTAEIVNELYDQIRMAAGSTYVLGCNTFSHLSAGVFELNRIGDDTSGRDWDRTRKMGVNALAYRAAHQGAFYAADADVAALTQSHKGRQALEWLRLLGLSGTPLFVSIEPSALGPEEWTALRDAFEKAAIRRDVAEPLDWMNSVCPRKWRIDGGRQEFDWSTPTGPNPFAS